MKKRRNNSRNKNNFKKNKIANPVASTSNQFLTNRFDSLSDMEDDFHDVISNSTGNSSSTAKPSPIIITDQNSTIGSISTSMNTLNIEQFSIKKIPIGLKV